MAKFFVGQRVRKVFAPSENPPVKVGTEGFVEEIKFTPKGARLRNGVILSEDNDIRVRYGSKVYLEVSAYVEPILPEGSQPLGYSFEKMMSEFGVEEAVK